MQESSSVRRWECSCLAKTFHCNRKGSEKTSQLPGTLHAAPHHCDPVTAFALSFWSKPEVSLSLFLFLAHSLHPPFSESLASQNSQSTNESSTADWVRKQKIMTSTDFSRTETLFIRGTEHQVGAASTRDV